MDDLLDQADAVLKQAPQDDLLVQAGRTLQEPRMAAARDWAKDWLGSHKELGGVTVRDVLDKSIPFVSAGRQVYQAEQYKDARKAYEKGDATDEQLGEMAKYELLQQRSAAKGIGQTAAQAALNLPAIAGEFAFGPARALAPAAGAGLGRQAIMRAGQGVLTPSLVAPAAEQRSIEQGGEAYDVKNLGPAAAMAAVKGAILGTVGPQAGAVPTVAGRTLAGTALGIAENQVGDVALSAVDNILPEAYQTKTKYGTVGHFLRGENGEGWKQLAGDAVAFGVFAAAHGREAKPVEKLAAAADALHEAGVPAETAAKTIQEAVGNPDTASGPIKEFVDSVAKAAEPPAAAEPEKPKQPIEQLTKEELNDLSKSLGWKPAKLKEHAEKAGFNKLAEAIIAARPENAPTSPVAEPTPPTGPEAVQPEIAPEAKPQEAAPVDRRQELRQDAADRRQNPAERKRVADMTPDERAKELLHSQVVDLPNRRAFDEARPAKAVAMSDADGLKALNDKFGYEAGNALLRAKAEALKEAGLDAYHEKGDEFLYRGESPEAIGAGLEKARQILKDREFDVTLADGSKLVLKGADFSYGVGHELSAAETGLKAHKAAREARGERARGELRGITEVTRGLGQVDRGPAEAQGPVNLLGETLPKTFGSRKKQQITLDDLHRERDRSGEPPPEMGKAEDIQPGEFGKPKLMTSEEAWQVPLLSWGEIDAKDSPWREVSVHKTHEEAATAAGLDGGVLQRAGPETVGNNGTLDNISRFGRGIAVPEWVAYKKAGSAEPAAPKSVKERFAAGEPVTFDEVAKEKGLTALEAHVVRERMNDARSFKDIANDRETRKPNGGKYTRQNLEAIERRAAAKLGLKESIHKAVHEKEQTERGRILAEGAARVEGRQLGADPEEVKPVVEKALNAREKEDAALADLTDKFLKGEIDEAAFAKGADAVRSVAPIRPRPAPGAGGGDQRPEVVPGQPGQADQGAAGSNPAGTGPGATPSGPRKGLGRRVQNANLKQNRTVRSLITELRKTGGVSKESARSLGLDVNALAEMKPSPFEDARGNPSKRHIEDVIPELVRSGDLIEQPNEHLHDTLVRKLEKGSASAEGIESADWEKKHLEFQKQQEAEDKTAQLKAIDSFLVDDGLPHAPIDEPGMFGGAMPNTNRLNLGQQRSAREFALAREKVTQERAERGEQAVLKDAARGNARAWDEAVATLKRDPKAGDEVVNRIETGAPINPDRDVPILLLRRVALSNLHDQAVREFNRFASTWLTDKAKHGPELEVFRRKMDDALAERDRLDLATNGVGAKIGRALQFFKQLAKEDYSLGRMIGEMTARKRGPLTETEVADITKLHEEIKSLQEQLAAKEAEPIPPAVTGDPLFTRIKNWLGNLFASKEPKERSKAWNFADRLEQEATKDLMNRFGPGKLFSGFDPTAIAPLAKYTAAKIIKTGLTFADFTKAVVARFGEPIKPHVDEIWKRANEHVAAEKEADDIRGEIIKKKQEYEEKGRGFDQANEGIVWKGLRRAGAIVDLQRAIKLGGDLPPILRQGGFATLARPAMSLRSVKGSAKAFPSEEGAYKNLAQIATRENNTNGNYKRGMNLDLKNVHGQDEFVQASLLRKIPWFSHTERWHSAYLTRLRADYFDTLAAGLTRGREMSVDEQKLIGNAVNEFTGRGNLGAMEHSVGILNKVFLAPKWVWSRYQVALGHPLWYGLRTYGLQPKARLAIAKEYMRMGTGVSAIYGLVGLAAAAGIKGLSVEDDPRSSDFGDIRIGNTRLNPTAGLNTTYRFLAQMLTGQRKSPTTGKIAPAGMGDVLGSEIRKKLAPVPATALTGTELSRKSMGLSKKGPPVPYSQTWGELAQDTFEPLTSEDFRKAIKDLGIPGGTAVGILASLGSNVKVFGK